MRCNFSPVGVISYINNAFELAEPIAVGDHALPVHKSELLSTYYMKRMLTALFLLSIREQIPNAY